MMPKATEKQKAKKMGFRYIPDATIVHRVDLVACLQMMPSLFAKEFFTKSLIIHLLVEMPLHDGDKKMASVCNSHREAQAPFSDPLPRD